MTYQIRSFSDIYTAVREELGVSSTDTTLVNRIKRDVNIVLQEVLAKKNWWWLHGDLTVTTPAYFNTGTCSVTQDSNIVTLTVAPGTSKTGYKFAVDGFAEVFDIESHTANSATVRLNSGYTGSTASAVTFRIWTDKVPLPTDCKDVETLWHAHSRAPLEILGISEFRRVQGMNPRAEGMPTYACIGDFNDPSVNSAISGLPVLTSRASSGNIKTLVFASTLPTSITSAVSNGDPVRLNVSGAGHYSYDGDVLVSSVSTTTTNNDTLTYVAPVSYDESATSDLTLTVTSFGQESEYRRYRWLYLHPAQNNARITLKGDYLKESIPLTNDSDEPPMPVDDRMVLVYGASYRGWKKLRNEEEAQVSRSLYEEKLAQMASKFQSSLDKPVFKPSQTYLNSKRSIVRGHRDRPTTFDGFGAGSGAQVVSGAANKVAQYDATGTLSSSSVSNTALGYVANLTSDAQTQLNSKMNAALLSGQIVLGNASNVATAVTPAGDVTIDNMGSTTVNTVGGSTAANIHAAEALANAATNANTASAIVKRDASGNFSAGTITATLSGAATSAGTLTGNLTGDVTSSGMTTSYANKVPLAKGGTNADLSATGGTSQYLKQATLGGAVTVGTIAQADLPTIALTGNVTGSASGGSIATTIGAGVVTNSMQATMANNTVKGNVSGSTASPSDVTLASAATASSVMYRDSSANTKVNSLIENLSSTATAAGTTTLTVGSSYTQVFTGTSTQTVALPVASTLATNQGFQIINQSTGNVTVQTSGGNTLVTVAQNQTATVTCVNTAGGTGTASWSYSLQAQTAGGAGTVTSVAVTMPTEFSVSGSPITSSGTIAVSKANQSANQIYAGPSSGAAAAPTFRSMALADLGSIINYYQGRTSSAASWTTTSTSYPGTLSNTGGNTLTQDAASGLTVTAAATSAPGITWTPSSSTAVYLVHASTCFFNGTQGANVGIRIWDGTTTIANGGGQEATTTGATEIKALALMGIYAPGTASAVTVKLDMAVSAGTGHILDGSGQSIASITWTLVQIKN